MTAAARGAAALGLALHRGGAHVGHRDVEEVLDRLADLGLVRAVQHPEGVLVVRLDELEALLGDDRAQDDAPDVVADRGHLDSSPSPASSPTSTSAPSSATASARWGRNISRFAALHLHRIALLQFSLI